MIRTLRLKRFLTFLSLAAVLSGCGSGPEIIQEVWSPDRHHKAVIYTVHLGATSELNTCVSVVDAPWGKLPKRPNAFVAVHGSPTSPQGPYFAPAITVRWVRPGQLEIAYDPAAKPVRRVNRVGDTRISYVVAPQKGLPFEWQQDSAKTTPAP